MKLNYQLIIPFYFAWTDGDSIAEVVAEVNGVTITKAKLGKKAVGGMLRIQGCNLTNCMFFH